jgi:hypothetical protein
LLSLPVLRCAARAAYKMAAGLHTPPSMHPSSELDSQSSDDLRKITKF